MAYSKQTWVRGEKVASTKLNHMEDGIYENSVTLEHGIEAAVDNWLDEHPEATTTVQDGSLTEEKFSDTLKLQTLKDYVTPEMFGAKGDGVTDDTSAINAALASNKNVLLLGHYAVSDSITLPEATHISGLDFRKSKITFASGKGIIIGGRYVTIENLEINGDGGNAISGVVSTTIADSMHMAYVHNVIINDFDVGIKFGTTTWDCVFENIRINNCGIGIDTITSGASAMLITFINVYFNHCTRDANLHAVRQCTFIGCNFGMIAFPCVHMENVSQVKFESCNFECDQQITSANKAMIDAFGLTASFEQCTFKINAVSTTFAFNVYSSLIGLTFMNCRHISLTGNAMPDNKFFNPASSNTGRYGAIVFESGNYMPRPAFNDAQVPNWIDKEKGRPIMFRGTNITKTKLSEGQVLYSLTEKCICVYNGTNVVKASDGTVIV